MTTLQPAEQTWDEQLAASTGVEIRPVPEGRRAMIPGKLMLYPSASLVNEAIRAIPAGQTVTPKELRATLATRYGAEYTCPVTLSRMLLIVAEAAHEAHAGGTPLADITPVWRVLDGTGSFPKRLSFDLGTYLDQRRAERPAD